MKLEIPDTDRTVISIGLQNEATRRFELANQLERDADAVNLRHDRDFAAPSQTAYRQLAEEMHRQGKLFHRYAEEVAI